MVLASSWVVMDEGACAHYVHFQLQMPIVVVESLVWITRHAPLYMLKNDGEKIAIIVRMLLESPIKSVNFATHKVVHFEVYMSLNLNVCTFTTLSINM